MNTFGRRFRVSLFGESHGAGVGVLVDGVPAGQPVDVARLQAALDARRPGTSRLVSARKESDRAQILSGVHRGRATGAPLAVWVANEDADSKSYVDVATVPRPGHADWVNHVWSGGNADLRGGGHASGRLTAGLVAAGALADGLLAPLGIACAAHVTQVGAIAGPVGTLSAAQMAKGRASPVGTAHKMLEGRMVAVVEAARAAGDSIGGAVAFAADGLPVGLGDPWMDPLESTLAHLLFAVPAVKAVSFGEGEGAAAMAGSAHNDAYALKSGRIRPTTNHAGGILGGRSTGERLWGQCTVKPASSIAREQVTADVATGKSRKVKVTGRHDPCIAIRAAPVIAACLSIALADAVLLGREQGLEGCWPAKAKAPGRATARDQ
ncbi:MAG: chorismate synthase [Candidatus Thermoplasmatota archaeon]